MSVEYFIGLIMGAIIGGFQAYQYGYTKGYRRSREVSKMLRLR